MQQTIPASCDLLITAACCVTQDKGRRVIDDAALAVTDGIITAVGSRAELASCLAKEHMALGEALLMPGLVNAHTHVSMTFLRGLGDDQPLAEWLEQTIFPAEKHLDAAMVELGALIGCAEMIRTGVTCFADMYLIEGAVGKAVDTTGLRALLGEAVFAFPSPAYNTVDEGLALVREQAAHYKGHSRIRTAVMPHAEYTTTPEILERCLELARELSLPLQIHLAETRREVEECRKTRGMSPVAYLHGLGFLSPSVSLAHCVVLDDADLDCIVQSGAHVVHNPRSNMKLASGVARLPEMLARGAAPALGTDGAASNNALNMFAEMSAGALMHKAHSLDPTLCPAQDMLDMATRNGAAALCWPELGQLAPGKAADIIALDLTSPNLMPLYNPVSHLVYSASGHEVAMTMVDGKVLYKDGTYHTLDYSSLIAEARKLRQWTLSRK